MQNKYPNKYTVLVNIRRQSWYLISLCLTCSIFSFFDSPDSFSKSGAILVVVGFILIASTGFLSYSKSIDDAVMKKNNYSKSMPDEDSDLYMQRLIETKAAILQENIGVLFSISGTLIWAYGGG